MSANELKVGDKAPDFTLPTDGEATLSLAGLRGRAVVLYFYPKDDTSGCTSQACTFRDEHALYADLQAEVVGVSRDTPASHDRFKAKHGLNFRLVSDAEGQLCEAYGVWKEKSMYGRKYFGIERSTFLIDREGVIRAVWRKVKVTGHSAEVRKALAGL